MVSFLLSHEGGILWVARRVTLGRLQQLTERLGERRVDTHGERNTDFKNPYIASESPCNQKILLVYQNH